MICSSLPVPKVATTNACVSPRVNKAEPCVRGNTPVRIVIGRTVRVSRPSIRGSPFKIWLRTVLASNLKNSSLILLASNVEVSSVMRVDITRDLISSNLLERSPFDLILNAALMSSAAKAATFSIIAVSGSGGVQSHASWPASAANSLII